MPQSAHAQGNRYWNGGSGNGLWNWNNNWWGSAPLLGDRVWFEDNDAPLVTTNNSGVNLNWVMFTDGATSARTINSGINLTDWSGAAGKIQNDSTATHTINGGVVLNGGNVTYEINPVSGNLVINGGVNANNAGKNINFFGGNTVTINGGITGNAGNGITLRADSGDIKVILNDTSGYTGNTAIDRGTLTIGGSISSSSLVLLGGDNSGQNATLVLSNTSAFGNITHIRSGSGTRTVQKVGANAQTMSGNITNNNSTAFNVSDSGGNLTLSGVYGGTGSLNKTGSGTLTLGGASANTNTNGAITVSAGTLILNKSANVAATAGSVTVNSGATMRADNVNQLNNQLVNVNGVFNMNNNSQQFALAGSGTLQLGSGTLTNTNTSTDTFGGKIEGSGNLVKTGTGQLVLTNTTSDFTGNVTINGGLLTINNDRALGAVPGSAANKIFVGAGTLAFDGDFTLTANRGIQLTSSSSTLDVFGTRTATYNGIISHSGTHTLNKLGTGTLILGGDNTFNGNTAISVGVLRAANSGALGTAGTVTVTAGAALQLSNNVSIARALTLNGDGNTSGSGSLRNVSGANTWSGGISNASGARINVDAGTLTVSGNITNADTTLYVGGVSNSTFSGTLTGSRTAGDGALFKDGAGTLTLGGNNSALSGTVFVRAGTLRTTNTGGLGSGTIQLGNGTTNTTLLIETNMSRAGGIAFSNNSTAAVINVASGQTFTNSGGLSQVGGTANTNKFGKDGAGTLVLAGSSSYAGQIQIGQGTVILGTANALGVNTDASGARAIDLGLNIGDTSTGNDVALLISNGLTISNSIYVAAASGSAVRTVGIAGSGSVTISNQMYLDGNVVFNAGSSASDSITMVSNITNTGGVIKTNAGILVLSASNSHSGGTTLSQGTLRAGNNNALGTGGFTINGGTFASTSGDARTITNAITMGGNVTFGDATGTGNLTLSNINLAQADRTLTIGNNTTIAGVISNGGVTAAALTKLGAGTLTLSGNNTFTGALTIGGGVVSVANNGNLGGGSAMTISNGAQLVTTGGFSSSRALTIGDGGGQINVAASTGFTNTGVVGGSTALTKTGTGTLALSNAASTYSGTVAVTAGTLQVNGTASSMGVNITNSGSVLMGAGSIGAVTVNSGTRIAPGNSVGNLSVSALTLEGGGGYNWEITAATGTPGTNWDLITVGGGSGTVTINATSGSPFTIFMQGNPTGWDVTNSYSWTIIDAGTLTGFATNAFAVNFSGFTGATPTGTFSFSNVSGNLVMAYSAPDTTYNVTVGANTAANQGSAQATNSLAQFTGASALNKLGAGTLIMTNPANNYSGVTTVKEGTLQINVNAPNNAAGALGTANTAVVIGDTAAAAAAGFNFGVAGITNDRGLSVVAGTGAADRIIGTTITSGVAEQAGTVAVNTNTVFQAASGGTLLVSGAISGAGNITISNSGLSIFSASNTYSGTTTILTDSTLRIANNGALGTNAGATTVNGGGTLALSNNISSAEGITINGSGVGSAGAIRNIHGNNTLSGGIVLGSASRINADTGTTLTLSGGVTGAGQALTLGGAGNITVSTTGINTTTSGSLTIDSTGVVTLGASGNYTGTTTLTSGTLRIGNNAALGTGGFSINGGILASDSSTARTITNAITMGSNVQFGDSTGTGALTLSNINLGTTTRTFTVSNNTTVAGAITNTGGLTKTGSGTLTLSGANTYTGTTTVNGGVLSLSGGSAIGNTNAVVITSGTLDLATGETVGSIDGAGNIALNGNQLIAGENNSSTVFSGIMSSTSTNGNFVKKGTGTLTLSGANTMNGPMYLVGGTTLFTVNQGATFTNTLFLGEEFADTAAATLAFGGSGLTITNAISVRSGSSGAMVIDAVNATGTTTLNGALTLAKNATIRATNGGSLLVNGNVSLGTSQLFANNSSGSSLTIAGNISAATNRTAELLVNNSGTVVLTGNNSADMKITLTAGTLQVGNITNLGAPSGSFFGDKLNLNGGTLSATNDVSAGANFGVTVSANGGNLHASSGRTLTLTDFINDTGAGTNAYTLGIGGGGTVALEKASGNNQFNNNMTFAVTNGSTLSTPNLLALGDSTTNIISLNNGTFAYTGSTGTASQRFTLGASGGTINVTAASLGTTLTLTNIVSGTGNTLTKTGDSILVLSGANTYGRSVISGGMLTVGADNNLGATPGSATADSITIGNGRLGLNGNFTVTANRGVTLTSANSTIDVYGGNSATVAGIIASSGAGALTKLGSGTLTLTGGNTYSNGTIVGVGVLRATAANSLGSADTAVTVSNGATLELSNATGFTMNRGLTLSGNGANGGALVSSAGANTNSGGILLATNARIAVTGGSLLLSGNITNGGNLLSLDTFGVTGTPLTIGGAISGAGALEKIGGGTAVLSGANSYEGTTLISAGALQVGNGGGTGQLGAGNVTNNSSLVFNRTGELTVSNVISGTGSLTKQAAGTVTLSGNNTYNGTTLISAGALQVGNGGGTGQLGAGNVTNNSSLIFNRTGELTVGNNISGTGSLTKQAAGTVTLSGNNTYSGATTIAGGTLRISGNNRLGNTNTTLTISNAGVLDVTAAGTITNAITIGAGNGVLANSSSGALVIAGAVSKNGTVLTSRSGSGTNVFTGVISGASANSDFIVDGGTTVFSNQMTYNGPTIITNGGTLVLGTNNATPVGSNLILGGGTLITGNASTRYSASLGTLTLSASSTIDLGSWNGQPGPVLNTLSFSNSTSITWAEGAILTITNWQGTAFTSSQVSQILFGDGGLTSTQLGQIRFANQGNQEGGFIGNELVPVPEPRVYAAAVALLATIGWRERKRLLGLLGRGKKPTV